MIKLQTMSEQNHMNDGMTAGTLDIAGGASYYGGATLLRSGAESLNPSLMKIGTALMKTALQGAVAHESAT